MDVLSRSFKKTPINKYGKMISKTQANRKFRREKYASDENFPSHKRNAYKNVTNRWEINDCVDYWSKEQAAAAYKNNYSEYSWFREEYPTLDDYLQYWEKCCKRK